MSDKKKIVIRVPINTCALKTQVNRVRQTKLPERVKQLVNQFALEHLNDDRKTFKSAWNQWICTGEIKQLLSEQTDSEMQNKMYFSARYYHRKKIVKEQVSVQTNDNHSVQTNDNHSVQTNAASCIDPNSSTEPKKETTRAYKKNDPSILQSIDEHLATLQTGPNGFLMKPADAYESFVSAAHMQPNLRPLLYVELSRIDRPIEKNIIVVPSLPSTVKKTYKNRFYMKEKRIISEFGSK